jgi:ABC-type Na+ efflux pump permease subunit
MRCERDGREGGMTNRIVLRLITKDVSLMRVPLTAYTAAAMAGLTLAGSPATRAAGITLALNVLIGVSFHVMLQPVLGERERKTLAFVMSLPASPTDAAVAKLLSAFLMFLIPGLFAATALVFLSPVDVLHAMAASDRSVVSHAAGWLGYYGLVLCGWLLFFSVVLATAIVTESVGWTIAVLTGLVFVFGNVVLQLAPKLVWFGRFIRELARGGPALVMTVGAEVAGIALVVAVMLVLQGRKTSFV